MILQKYQIDLIQKMIQYKGRGTLQVTGRQSGKSTLNQQLALYQMMMAELTPYTKLSTAEVDGAPWYTVKCNKEVAEFVRNQPGKDTHWYEHLDHNWYIHKNMFDINEALYIQIGLKFGK